MLYITSCIRDENVIPVKPVLAKVGSGNPEKQWIPGQSRNDGLLETYLKFLYLIGTPLML